ncbi:hypothetical protein HZ326_2045 [Fusarium oxysporum f. sp. albedinis]|nr:hypothetical protein HZ326_2045 [Fusarium oxysporum f. sp. albedinis]
MYGPLDQYAVFGGSATLLCGHPAIRQTRYITASDRTLSSPDDQKETTSPNLHYSSVLASIYAENSEANTQLPCRSMSQGKVTPVTIDRLNNTSE